MCAKARGTLERMKTQTRTSPARWAVAAVAAIVGVAAIWVILARGDAQSGSDQFRYSHSTARGSLIPLADRKKAGDLTATLLSGSGSYTLNQDAGKVVVLTYFASWCGPCQTETPQLDLLYRERKAGGIQFVGVDTKEPTESSGRSWVQNKDLSFPVVFDQKAKTALQLGNIPITIPASVLIDKQGRVAAVYLGSTTPKDLSPVLDTLANET
jgi:peroxiredoxin